MYKRLALLVVAIVLASVLKTQGLQEVFMCTALYLGVTSIVCLVSRDLGLFDNRSGEGFVRDLEIGITTLTLFIVVSPFIYIFTKANELFNRFRLNY